MIRYIDEMPHDFWQGKRVLLRVGFDMGKNFSAMEEFRINAGMPTIKFLLERGSRILILNHSGRPEGKIAPELSNDAIGKRLSELLGQDIPLLPLGTSSFDTPLAILENLRFDPGEEANDVSFAQKLAALGDTYVNDAFPNCHRSHASMTTLATLLPHFAGLHLKQELSVLTQARDYPLQPLLIVIGGAKVETKIKIITNFWDKAQSIILGGILANTILHAQGIAIGKSLIEPEYLSQLKGISITDTRLHLPVDVRVASDFEGTSGVRIAPVGNLSDQEIILDIGPDTELLFDNVIKSARMVIWNGPMGKYEIQAFSHGTYHVLASFLSTCAQVIAGGGETVEFLESQQVLDKFFFVSTGGGAMLSFLAGEPMPALNALQS